MSDWKWVKIRWERTRARDWKRVDIKWEGDDDFITFDREELEEDYGKEAVEAIEHIRVTFLRLLDKRDFEVESENVLPELVEKCFNWARSRLITQLRYKDIDNFLNEINEELHPKNRKKLYSLVNEKISS